MIVHFMLRFSELNVLWTFRVGVKTCSGLSLWVVFVSLLIASCYFFVMSLERLLLSWLPTQFGHHYSPMWSAGSTSQAVNACEWTPTHLCCLFPNSAHLSVSRGVCDMRRALMRPLINLLTTAGHRETVVWRTVTVTQPKVNWGLGALPQSRPPSCRHSIGRHCKL